MDKSTISKCSQPACGRQQKFKCWRGGALGSLHVVIRKDTPKDNGVQYRNSPRGRERGLFINIRRSSFSDCSCGGRGHRGGRAARGEPRANLISRLPSFDAIIVCDTWPACQARGAIQQREMSRQVLRQVLRQV